MDIKGELRFYNIAVESLDGSLVQVEFRHQYYLNPDVVHAGEGLKKRSPALGQLTGWIEHCRKVEKRLIAFCMERWIHNETAIHIGRQSQRMC